MGLHERIQLFRRNRRLSDMRILVFKQEKTNEEAELYTSATKDSDLIFDEP